MRKLQQILTAQELWPCFTTLEMPVLPTLAELEWNGFGFDRYCIHPKWQPSSHTGLC